MLSAMFTFGMMGDGDQAFDPLVLLVIALLAEGYFGQASALYRRGWHPMAQLSRLIATLERKLNRAKRSEMDRAVRGLLGACVVMGVAGGFGALIAFMSLHHPFGWALEVLILILCLNGRGAYDEVQALGPSLREGLEPARRALEDLPKGPESQDARYLDEHGVLRVGIARLARCYVEGVVAPVFWYILFGLPGALIYLAVLRMAEQVGRDTPELRAFGMSAVRLHDVLGLIPARLGGVFMVIAATFSPTAKPLRAMKTMLRDAGKHVSATAGWPMSALAGALSLGLGGPRRFAHGVHKEAWVGDGTARLELKDLKRALYLYAVALLVNGVWVCAFSVIRYSLP